MFPLFDSWFSFHASRNFFYPDSVKDLVVKNFVEKMTLGNHNNLQIENHEDHILIKYNGAKFGYKYNATYYL